MADAVNRNYDGFATMEPHFWRRSDRGVTADLFPGGRGVPAHSRKVGAKIQ